VGLVVALVATTALACVPETPWEPAPTTTTTTTTTTPTPPPRVTVTPDPTDIAPGTTVTVTGNGFDPAGNIGTRPPLAGQPAGVYVVFGRFADPWKPSAGAPGSARQIIQQKWALPAASRAILDPTFSNPAFVTMNPDGTFTAELTLTEAPGTNPTYGVAVFPGSGAINPDDEFLVPVTFAP
jgi:hypothetical protein